MSQSNLDHPDQYQMQRLKEMLIVVDENDQVIGTDSKMNCHLNINIEKGNIGNVYVVNIESASLVFPESVRDTVGYGLRASASWFLRSLVFYRKQTFATIESRDQIFFPGYFSDSCSSHPLYEPLDMEESLAIGMKRAAKRRLHAELGIPQEQISLDDIVLVARIHYKLRITEVLGEHEIGYLLFVRKDVTLNPDPKEVKDYIYVTKEELENLLEQETKDKPKFTGWFHIIANHVLFKIWDNLNDVSPLVEPDKIHRV